jgi:anti-sigma factor RsiW
MQDRYFTDEELVAYLDGEDDFAPVAEINFAVKNDDVLAQRIDDMRIDTEKIARSFEALRLGEMSELPEAPASNDNSKSFMNLIAASALALAVGFGAGFTSGQVNSQPGWREYVASYQALYINSTLKDVTEAASKNQNELSRVASAIGKDIQIENLNITSEVEYKRAQILGFNGKPLIQIAFLDSMGQPIALCIIRSDGEKGTDILPETMEGMSSASWNNKGYEYILIGGQNQSLIDRLASEFSRTI